MRKYENNGENGTQISMCVQGKNQNNETKARFHKPGENNLQMQRTTGIFTFKINPVYVGG